MFLFQEIKIPKRRFSKCSKKTLFLFSLHKWGKMTEPSILIASQQDLQVRNLLGFKRNIELNLICIAVTRNVLKSVKMCRRGSRNNRIETAKAPKWNLVAHRRQEKWERTSKIQTEYLWWRYNFISCRFRFARSWRRDANWSRIRADLFTELRHWKRTGESNGSISAARSHFTIDSSHSSYNSQRADISSRGRISRDRWWRNTYPFMMCWFFFYLKL